MGLFEKRLQYRGTRASDSGMASGIRWMRGTSLRVGQGQQIRMRGVVAMSSYCPLGQHLLYLSCLVSHVREHTDDDSPVPVLLEPQSSSALFLL
jgi:hypothetical protein